MSIWAEILDKKISSSINNIEKQLIHFQIII